MSDNKKEERQMRYSVCLLINSDLLTQNIDCAKKYGSSITSGIVKETIVEVFDVGGIKAVPDRAHSRVAKAPQCFCCAQKRIEEWKD